MKFSLIYEAQTAHNSRAGDRQVFDEVVEQALLAEQLGFDVIWAVEHTCLTHYAHMSAPETFLAFIAGATTRIGIGHGVICLPPADEPPGEGRRALRHARHPLPRDGCTSDSARAAPSRRPVPSATTSRTCDR